MTLSTASSWRSLRLVPLVLVLTLAVSLSIPGAAAAAEPGRDEASLELFVQQTVAAANRIWGRAMSDLELSYRPPRVEPIFADQRPEKVCGVRRLTHMYCLQSETVYVDYDSEAPESFASLWKQDRPFVIVVVVGHECGHHAQKVRGYFDGGLDFARTEEARRRIVKFELHADCLMGLFSSSYSALARRVEPRDLADAIENTRQLGAAADTPTVVRTHGTPEQRVAAFLIGHDRRDPRACGT